MSGSGTQRGDDAEEDCPLCLEPLPPFWDMGGRAVAPCCGKSMCIDCKGKEIEYVRRARASGSYGRQEEQLASTCPLCRTQKPRIDNAGRTMADSFEKGELPLNLYWVLGGKLVDGQGGVGRNVEKAIEIFMLGAERGDPNCQFSLGVRYQEGTDGFPRSLGQAKRWYLAATDQAHAIAEYNLALMFADEGNDEEYLRCPRGSASNGYDDACYNLGIAYSKGQCGLQTSAEEAIRVLTPAAERGHVQSMTLLGTNMCYPDYLSPPPSNPNFTKGVHWLRRAAAKGDKNAIATLPIAEKNASSMCFMCEKEAPTEKAHLRCVRCRAAWYCSKDCQRRHWRAEEGHTQCCIKCPVDKTPIE